jgi:hypothetical protein
VARNRSSDVVEDGENTAGNLGCLIEGCGLVGCSSLLMVVLATVIALGVAHISAKTPFVPVSRDTARIHFNLGK